MLLVTLYLVQESYKVVMRQNNLMEMVTKREGK